MNVSELPEKLKEIQPHYLWWQGGHGNLMQYGTKETFSKFCFRINWNLKNCFCVTKSQVRIINDCAEVISEAGFNL